MGPRRRSNGRSASWRTASATIASSSLAWDGAQVSDVERDRPRCLHDLEHVVGPDLEDGAQGFMAPYDLVERTLQRFDIEGPDDDGHRSEG